MDHIFEERKKSFMRCDIINLLQVQEDNKLTLRKKQVDKYINMRRFSGRSFKKLSYDDLFQLENFNNFLKRPSNDKTFDYLLSNEILESITRYLEEYKEYNRIDMIFDFVFNNIIRLGIREEYSEDCITKLVKLNLYRVNCWRYIIYLLSIIEIRCHIRLLIIELYLHF